MHAWCSLALVGATAAVTLRVATTQPGPAAVPSRWLLDGTPLNVVPILPTPRAYHVLLPSRAADLDLQMLTPTFVAPGDPRSLAFGADILQFSP